MMLQELKAHLDDAVDQVKEYRNLRTELSEQCAELERENFEIRSENDMLLKSNRSLRLVPRISQQLLKINKISCCKII